MFCLLFHSECRVSFNSDGDLSNSPQSNITDGKDELHSSISVESSSLKSESISSTSNHDLHSRNNNMLAHPIDESLFETVPKEIIHDPASENDEVNTFISSETQGLC